MDVLVILFLLGVYFVSPVVTVDADNDSIVLDYDRLMNDLLRRPVMVHRIRAEITCTTRDPCVLNFSMTLVQIVQVDQIEQLMTVVGLFDIGWFHGGLVWDPSDYGGLESIDMATAEMWVPQLGIWIGDRGSTTFTYPDSLTLNSSGYVYFRSLSYVTFRCTINVRKFPFDTQTCNFAPYLTSQIRFNVPGQLNLMGAPFSKSVLTNDDPYNLIGEWVLQNFTVGTFSEDSDGAFPTYVMKVTRQRLYYVIVVIFPMVLTSLMIPLVFLIPNNSGEKLSYLMTIYTSSAIFLSYTSQVMPKNLSSGTPYLAILLTEVISLGLCATLAALWVVNTYNSEEKAKIFAHRNVNTSHSVQIPDQGRFHIQEAWTEPNDMRSGDKVVISKTRLTGSQLDWFFFSFFLIGQNVFLVTLFFGTDWLD